MSIEIGGFSGAARRVRVGISGRATLLILAIVSAALVACSSYLYLSQSSTLQGDVDASMSSLSGSAARSVGNWLRGKLDLTQMMAQQITASGRESDTDRVLDAPIIRDSFYVSFFGRPDGFYTKMPKAEIPPGYDPRQRPWYKEAAATDGPILTEPYISASRGTFIITAAAPVKDAAHGLGGVVGSDFDVSALARMITEVAPGNGGYAYLVSGAGTILIHPRAAFIGKPLSELIDGPVPGIAAGRAVDTREAGRSVRTVFARVPNLPPALDWYVALSVDHATAFAPITHLAQNLAIATAITLLLLAVTVSRMMAATVAHPLDRLVEVLQRMSLGDLDTEIAEARRRDEIGMVGRAVEGIKAVVAQKAREQEQARRSAEAAAAAERKRAMTALADGFEEAVGTIVGSVSSAASELHATAQALTNTATQAAARSSSVAAAADQASTSVRTVAVAADELGASVREIAGQVAGSSRLARTAVDEADETGHRVQALSEAVSRISDAAGLIASIAAQTNLLALNATIEAARAGEAGLGFAVVAAEVKDLAAQTARATEEINDHIARVQGSTGEATRALDGIVRRIRDINAVAAAVAASVEEQGAATQEIVRNVTQASDGTADVTVNIAGVAGAAAHTGEAARQVLGSASDLSQHSARLGVEVARFLDSVRAA
ncbi:methyl-accepting chemotaxis protein [Methylobacterium fujisawaense]|uniref:Methyl-accepting chemotaxis protein n=1 Tax=Methylobacterium fujisawaense TaxID=107400 RepID=A0ABR6D897_9HYPH|nr:methyl-accepting chemotaxis protein [Methylobacterium fujisawaense]MBA9062020.1 methyl-accepting chemotaxis protein [Methylobacterium fujisawaense]